MSDVIDFRAESLSERRRPNPIGSFGKRAVDIAISLSALILLLPLFVFCYVAIALTTSGPVIFRHRRVGFRGQSFDCLKFTSMVPDASERLQEYLLANPEAMQEWATTRKLKYDPRITWIGGFLRKTSLDELPQILNVLFGDMSIVGPRPVTKEELTRYADRVTDYLACRPGITGLWQVSGRSTTTYGKRVACDTFYARNWTMLLDFKIMLATLPSMLESDNAY